jgi:hypothetical protein
MISVEKNWETWVVQGVLSVGIDYVRSVCVCACVCVHMHMWNEIIKTDLKYYSVQTSSPVIPSYQMVFILIF